MKIVVKAVTKKYKSVLISGQSYTAAAAAVAVLNSAANVFQASSLIFRDTVFVTFHDPFEFEPQIIRQNLVLHNIISLGGASVGHRTSDLAS